MTKHIAKTLVKLSTSDALQRVLDRFQPIEDLITNLVDHWGFDLYSRKPGPAYDSDGVFKGTDLDLACFLSALVDRKAVIVLPTYERMRAVSKREGERVISKENRHGQLQGLVSNKKVLSFSVRILDQNVIRSGNETEGDQVGAFRNFTLVDVHGKWHDGWKNIEFMPSAQENEFLNDKALWSGTNISFKNFVAPQRWVSFFGQYYTLTKVLINRLEQEVEFANTSVQTLEQAGVRWPPWGEHGAKKEWPVTTKGASKSIKVDAFEAEVDAEFYGIFKPYPKTTEGLVEAATVARTLKNKVIPALRFPIRCTELAFVQAGCKDKGFPSWISGAKWEEGYIPKGTRTEWNRLVLNQTFPGQKALALRYRVFQKSEQVSAE